MTKSPKRAKIAKKAGPPGAKRAGPPKKRLVAKKETPKKGAIKKASVRKVRAPKRAVPIDLSGATAAVLDRLFAVVTSRRDADPTVSHSARLLSRGTAKVAQKFGEEAVECLIEAVGGNNARLVGESADVLYHLIVLWVDAGLDPADVWSELQRRQGTSGIVEKAARGLPAATTDGAAGAGAGVER